MMSYKQPALDYFFRSVRSYSIKFDKQAHQVHYRGDMVKKWSTPHSTKAFRSLYIKFEQHAQVEKRKSF